MSSKSEREQLKKRNRSVVSCTECHRRKQRCDRALPCNDCRERRVPKKCQYLTPKQDQLPGSKSAAKSAVSKFRRLVSGKEVILTPESVAALADSQVAHVASPSSTGGESDGLRNPPITLPRRGYALSLPKSGTVASGLHDNNSLSSYDPFSILPDIPGEPLPKHLLIRYYVERLAPWLCHLDDRFRGLDDISKIQEPKIAWLGYAVEHTAFYYATLLSAAVHLNRRRKLKDPAALIWYKVQTIALANEQMNIPNQAASDEMIMTALILCNFNVGGNNVEEYEIHLRGINQMLEARGGLEATGMRGMVKNWLGDSHGPWSEGFEYGAFVR